MDESGEQNPYLLGVYAPVQDEITAENLQVIGEIPRDLNGVYLRNGPNARFPMKGRYHWFDGDGMVHAMHFENGRARYRNRYVRTKAFEAETAEQKSLWTGVMESPKGNPFGNTRGLGLKDSANTDVIFHRGQVLATWYLCGAPYGIDPLSLETLGVQTFLDTLTGDFMAHPKVDERTGELFWFDYGPRKPYLRYGVVGAEGAVEHCVELDLPGARLPHDMGITENYAILMDLPLYQDLDAAREGRYKLTFNRDLPSRFGVIPRRGTQIRWFEAKPCYIYHVVNSWEEGDEIVMDVCRVSRPAPAGSGSPLSRMISYLKLDARMYRYRFNLVTGQTSETYVDEDHNTEFPSIDARRAGYLSRYAYNVSVKDAATNLFDGLVRYDNVTGAKETHYFGEHRYGSEAPFAPRDGATAEDDGYLVSFVTDEREGTSEVQILDASRISEGPVARVLLPVRVPLGFHATWVRADQLR